MFLAAARAPTRSTLRESESGAPATRSAKLGVRERQHERPVSRCFLRQLAPLPAPRCASPSPGRPRHGKRSLGCGSGSMSAPFYDVSCGSLRPFPLHARASPSPGRPRHGQRSLGCGSSSMSAPFHDVSCGSSRPYPLHAARVRVRGALPARTALSLGLRICGDHSARLASRPGSRKADVAATRDLIRGSYISPAINLITFCSSKPLLSTLRYATPSAASTSASCTPATEASCRDNPLARRLSIAGIG